MSPSLEIRRGGDTAADSGGQAQALCKVTAMGGAAFRVW